MADDDSKLQKLYADTKKVLKVIGLEINEDKTASNTISMNADMPVLDEHEGYKYLGVLENSKNQISPKAKQTVFENIKDRIKRLCSSNLSGPNLMHGINEYAISLLNYYCGVIEIEPKEYAKLDIDIRKILIDHKIHYKVANKERLYLQRERLGRGLQSTEDRAERILLEFHNYLANKKHTCQRKRCIIENETHNMTHLGLIKQYIKDKYKSNTEVTLHQLKEMQETSKEEIIQAKALHSVLFKATKDENVDIKTSSNWLKKGNNTAKSEALYCMLQDRNMFLGKSDMCNHCKTSKKTVDHLATRCGRLLYINYVHRHDEVLRCIHLHYATKYGFKSSKKIKTHQAVKFLENSKAIIKTDTFIHTDIKINCNKPDIYIYDKSNNQITLVEIGITSQEKLKTVESEKYRKYDLLAKELSIMHKCTVEIIPFVMTWDGIVTKYHNVHVRKIGIDNNTKAYIQSIVLKKTLEAISFDYRRHNDAKGIRREVAIAEAFEEIAASVDVDERDE